jgi:hypothetical protein
MPNMRLSLIVGHACVPASAWLCEVSTARSPWPTPLQDLAAYKKFRDKEVASAARSVIGLFRDINPGGLPRGRLKTARGPLTDAARRLGMQWQLSRELGTVLLADQVPRQRRGEGAPRRPGAAGAPGRPCCAQSNPAMPALSPHPQPSSPSATAAAALSLQLPLPPTAPPLCWSVLRARSCCKRH